MLPEFVFHHIAIAVNCLEDTAQLYVDAGFKKSEMFTDMNQNVRICWLSKENSPLIELVAPIDQSSPVVKYLSKNGVGPYHTCYSVKNLDIALGKMKSLRYLQVSKPAEAPAIENHRVVFLYNKNIGLIELVEIPD